MAEKVKEMGKNALIRRWLPHEHQQERIITFDSVMVHPKLAMSTGQLLIFLELPQH